MRSFRSQFILLRKQKILIKICMGLLFGFISSHAGLWYLYNREINGQFGPSVYDWLALPSLPGSLLYDALWTDRDWGIGEWWECRHAMAVLNAGIWGMMFGFIWHAALLITKPEGQRVT